MMKYSIVNFIATATTMIGLITDIIKYIPIEYEYLYHTSSLHQLLEFNGHQPSAIKKKTDYESTVLEKCSISIAHRHSI